VKIDKYLDTLYLFGATEVLKL